MAEDDLSSANRESDPPSFDFDEDAISSLLDAFVEGPNNVGVYFYDGNLLVLASFRDVPSRVTLTCTDQRPYTFHN